MKVIGKLILKSDSMFCLFDVCGCVYIIAIVHEKQIIFTSANNGLVI